MASRSLITPRRVPRQERGERRVAALLEAAAAEIAEMGCEGATMSGIAERAGACIGSLYQFFP
ncbi:MAG: TetR/AcrR family transcriptional regulator, partial [Acidobacteriota bacterium]|nr:TetR/AcrR family transcriptional regulator [Acidobacteriota bacterium]